MNTPEYFNELLLDGSKRGVLIDSDMLSLVAKDWNRFQYTKLAQRVIFNHKGFLFRSNIFFFDAFNEKLAQLVEAGIAEKFVDEETNSQKQEESEPVVLTLDHLGVGFKICLLFLAISFGFFLLEFAPSIYRRVFSL